MATQLKVQEYLPCNSPAFIDFKCFGCLPHFFSALVTFACTVPRYLSLIKSPRYLFASAFTENINIIIIHCGGSADKETFIICSIELCVNKQGIGEMFLLLAIRLFCVWLFLKPPVRRSVVSWRRWTSLSWALLCIGRKELSPGKYFFCKNYMLSAFIAERTLAGISSRQFSFRFELVCLPF